MARSLTSLFLLWLLPAGALAQQFTLTSIKLDLRIDATNGTDSAPKGTFTVTGTKLGTAILTPQGQSPITLSCDPTGTTCQNTPPAQLSQLPIGITISLTELGGTATITDTESLTLPNVPSPAISEPKPQIPVDPTALNVIFTACGSPCGTNPSEGLLTKGTTERAKADLAPTATSWKPTPAPPLEAESEFNVKITHRATGSRSPPPTYEQGTETVTYSITFDVKHSDTVTFKTGFAPPTGTFCIISNGTALGTGCAILDDTALGILDTSTTDPADPPETTLGGIKIVYQITLGPKGEVTGTASADLDGDKTPETSAPLTGRLRGKNGVLRQRLRARFVDDALDAKLRLRILEDANLASIQSDILTTLLSEELRGKNAGTKVDASSSSKTEITDPPVGWRLDFTLAGSDSDVSAQLQAAGSTITLGGTQRFDTANNQSDVRLSSSGAEKGIQFRIRELEIDKTAIASGELKFRAFGQSGSGLLP